MFKQLTSSATAFSTRLILSLFPFVSWMRLVTPQTLKIDFSAAVTSAIFALPQGIAFALIAGLPPEFGLYAAIVAPIVSAFFGSSWHNVSGPTVATSIVVISIIGTYAVPQSPQFIGFVLMLTLLAGIIQLLLGIFRLGHIVNFISHTVLLGFTTGAAILIISSQLANFMGISIERQSNIALQLQTIFKHLGEVNYVILLLSSLTLACALICMKYFKRLPYLLVAMAVGAIISFIISYFFKVETIGMVGALPSGLPSLTFPDLTFYNARQLFSAAIAIATLGLIQTVSISKSIANKSGQRIDANQEFIGQGLTNIACSFFSGFFSSSSFTRTGVNYTAGAITPLSSVMASGLIILLLLFAAGSTKYLPTATMSAIIMLVGWRLIDFGHIIKIAKTSSTETIIFVITLLSTLFLTLEFAIYSGVILSLILYLQKTSQPDVVDLTTDKFDSYRRLVAITNDKQKECPQLNILRIDGSLFFGAIHHVEQKILDITQPKQTDVLIICDGVTLIDISGAEMLLKIRTRLQVKGGDLYLSGLTSEARKYLVNSPYWAQLGASKNIYNFSVEAVGYIFNQLDHKECKYCDKRVFAECDQIEQIKITK